MSFDSVPSVVKLEAGDRKALCMCGESKNKPYCDGGHAGTGLKPVIYTCKAAESLAVCQCGKSANSPRCDGSHRS